MSLINDALKRAENAKLDKLSQAESPPEMPIATHGRSTRKRLFGPITVVCLLLIGAALVAYRYWGPGDGPGPQAATADLKAPAPPATVAAPKVDEWVNPAFKDLTPQAANAIRAEVAESLVTQFFNAGSAMNDYATSLASPRPARAEPPVKTAKATKLDIAKAKPPKPPVTPPKPPAAPPADPKPKAIPSAIAAGVDPTTFRVSGIMFNGANSKAIINEGVYRVGQKVSGAVVESITPSAVVLRVGDKKFKVGM